MSIQKKPRYRWSQLLKPKQEPVTPELNAKFERGKRIHEMIQGLFPYWCAEKSGTFEDPALPFLIDYHADLFSPSARLVVEIKPLTWGLENEEYCLKQLSGYYHFLGASKARFLWYHWDNYPSWPPILMFEPVVPINWVFLRKEALCGYEILTAGGCA